MRVRTLAVQRPIGLVSNVNMQEGYAAIESQRGETHDLSFD